MLEFLQDLIVFTLHISDYGVLPKKLTAEQERRLLERKMQGDSEAEKLLVKHNLRLVIHVIKKYCADEYEQDDLISVGTVGLIKGIHTFDPIKGTKLATYSAKCIENEILMYFRGKNKYNSEMSIHDPIETDAEGNPLTIGDILSTDDKTVDNMIKEEDLKRTSELVAKMRPGREKQIIIMRYGLEGCKPKTQAQVAKELNISRSYVSRIESKVLAKMRDDFDKE